MGSRKGRTSGGRTATEVEDLMDQMNYRQLTMAEASLGMTGRLVEGRKKEKRHKRSKAARKARKANRK